MCEYSILGKEVVASDILYMFQFFLCGKISIESLLIGFFLKLLEIGLFSGNFHISQSLSFLLFKLFSILIDLDGLIVEDIIFDLLHFVSPVLLLLLLPPPDVRLDLLHPFSVSTR